MGASYLLDVGSCCNQCSVSGFSGYPVCFLIKSAWTRLEHIVS